MKLWILALFLTIPSVTEATESAQEVARRVVQKYCDFLPMSGYSVQPSEFGKRALWVEMLKDGNERMMTLGALWLAEHDGERRKAYADSEERSEADLLPIYFSTEADLRVLREHFGIKAQPVRSDNVG